MQAICSECGAALAYGGVCADNFHALLSLESEAIAPDAESSVADGEIAHFYAVSSYVLQHPVSMGYTGEALVGLRQAVADHLFGRATLEDLRRRVRGASNGSARIKRRSDDKIFEWPLSAWPVNVEYVLAGGAQSYEYRVTEWGQSIVVTLDALDAAPMGVSKPQTARSVTP